MTHLDHTIVDPRALIQRTRFVLLYVHLLQMDSDLMIQIFSLVEIDAPVASPSARFVS